MVIIATVAEDLRASENGVGKRDLVVAAVALFQRGVLGNPDQGDDELPDADGGVFLRRCHWRYFRSRSHESMSSVRYPAIIHPNPMIDTGSIQIGNVRSKNTRRMKV